MMVTAGAAANVQQCTFQSNSVINYGDFGGAIFHDYVSLSGSASAHTLLSLTLLHCPSCAIDRRRWLSAWCSDACQHMPSSALPTSECGHAHAAAADSPVLALLQCRTNRVSTFSENRFINNVSQGFGGAIKVTNDNQCQPCFCTCSMGACSRGCTGLARTVHRLLTTWALATGRLAGRRLQAQDPAQHLPGQPRQADRER